MAHSYVDTDVIIRLLTGLELFAQTTLDYGDVFIVATMEHAGAQTLYSYDVKLGRVPGVSRHEP